MTSQNEPALKIDAFSQEEKLCRYIFKLENEFKRHGLVTNSVSHFLRLLLSRTNSSIQTVLPTFMVKFEFNVIL